MLLLIYYSAVFLLLQSKLVNSFRVFSRRSFINCKTLNVATSFLGCVDEEEIVSGQRIVNNYLKAKFKNCDIKGENCRIFCNRQEFEELFKLVLPPVTKSELKVELEKSIEKLGLPASQTDFDVSEDEFLKTVISNSYWSQAGLFVVKELILLDCLYNYYYNNKKSILNNEDYDELKESLSWEGSSVSNLSASELQFIIAVSAYSKGTPILDDKNYEKLKNQLVSDNSWVVTRKLDALEKLGLNTFLGYLHRVL
eukprot:gene11983-16041_t